LILWALTLLVIGALFEKSLSKISQFECVANSLAPGVLREEIVVEAMLVQYQRVKVR
jgi:archaellum component FlaG (FlaF/FlaG flagellin family)